VESLSTAERQDVNESVKSVSIILVHSGDAAMLETCLVSIAKQKLPPVEVLVLTDAPGPIVDLPSMQHPGVKLINFENHTAWYARAKNLAIRLSEGRFIYFMTSRHNLHPDCLHELTRQICVSPTPAICYSSFEFANKALAGIRWGIGFNQYHLLNNHLIGEACLILKSDVLQARVFFNEDIINGVEDWEFHVRLANNGFQFSHVQKVLYRCSAEEPGAFPPDPQWHKQASTIIRNCNPDIYNYRNLLRTKREFAPGLTIPPDTMSGKSVAEFIERQSYRDWSAISTSGIAPYRLEVCGHTFLDLLPPEALETAVLVMETDPGTGTCIITINEEKVLQIVRQTDPANLYRYGNDIKKISFGVDKASTSGSAGYSDKTGQDISMVTRSGVEVTRHVFSKMAGKIIGSRARSVCINKYNRVYEFIHSKEFHAFRVRLASSVSPWLQSIFDRLVYPLCLARMPVIKTSQDWVNYYSGVLKLPCYLQEPDADSRLNLMIATSRLEHGGVEKILIDLIEGLDKQRFNIILVTTSLSSHPWADRVRKAGGRVYNLDRVASPGVITHLIQNFAIMKMIDSVFIMHSLPAYMAVRHLRRELPQIRIYDRNEVCEGADDFPHCSINVGGASVDLRTVGHKQLATYMASISQGAVDDYRVIYYGPPVMSVDANAVSLRKLCNINDENPVVLFAGRFTQQKRPEIFVEVANSVLQQAGDQKVHFAMLGNGELFETTRDLIVKLGLQSNIHLLGARNDAQALLAQATLLLMPSEYEGLALVSYEAMALGVPQVFADVNGQSELVDEKTGILVQNGSGEIDRYAEACMTLLNDEQRRLKMGAAGTRRIKEYFSYDTFVTSYSTLFGCEADWYDGTHVKNNKHIIEASAP